MKGFSGMGQNRGDYSSFLDFIPENAINEALSSINISADSYPDDPQFYSDYGGFKQHFKFKVCLAISSIEDGESLLEDTNVNKQKDYLSKLNLSLNKTISRLEKIEYTHLLNSDFNFENIIASNYRSYYERISNQGDFRHKLQLVHDATVTSELSNFDVLITQTLENLRSIQKLTIHQLNCLKIEPNPVFKDTVEYTSLGKDRRLFYELIVIYMSLKNQKPRISKKDDEYFGETFKFLKILLPYSSYSKYKSDAAIYGVYQRLKNLSFVKKKISTYVSK
jgi:hypothetical protein